MSSSRPVHFLHIRKTGGTAVKEALFPLAKRYGIILHNHQTKLSDIPKNHPFFFFLRHPIPRFVSSFYSRLRRGLPRYADSPWNPVEVAAFAIFKTANDLAEALSSKDLRTAYHARAAMQGIAHVNATYRTWFASQQELDERIDSLLMLGIQEHLDEDFETLKVMLGLPAPLALPNDDVRAHRTPSIYNRSLSSLAQQNLQQWFATDIQFYEHCVQLRSERLLPLVVK